MRFVLLLLLLALAACTPEKVNVTVNCETTTDGISCDVKQAAGKSEVEACWDFAVTCANGIVVKAPRTCTKVKDGGTAKVSIANDRLENHDQCGGNGKPTAALSNLTIDGKAVELKPLESK